MNFSQALRCAAATAVVAVVVITCKNDGTDTESTQGKGCAIEGTTWQRSDRNGNKINITFGKNGEFRLDFHSLGMRFDGVYFLSGSAMRIVDRYCGTGLPGVYKVRRNGDELSFEILADSLCDRNKILPQGAWTPDMHPDRQVELTRQQ